MIAIKGFEMPKSCWECGAVRGSVKALVCVISDEEITSDKWDEIRHESCPLVEIPDHVG